MGVWREVGRRRGHRARLAMGNACRRSASRTVGAFGDAVAPTGEGDSEEGEERSLEASETTNADAETPHRIPCWIDKYLDLPREGFCHVPWNAGLVFQVMILWFAAFLLVGHVGLPSVVTWLGFNCRELSARGLALYSLSADVVEMFVGLGVLYQCLRPYFPLPKRWFPIALKGRWWMEILRGCVAFPIVTATVNLNSAMMPVSSASLPMSPWEQVMISNDILSVCFYIGVVSLVAPVWEEMIFRGFLMPSLTRYFRMDVAIVLSSFLFAAAHFSMERLLPLTVLGMLMCVVYIRSKNILAPIVLHSLWNFCALFEIYGVAFVWQKVAGFVMNLI